MSELHFKLFDCRISHSWRTRRGECYHFLGNQVLFYVFISFVEKWIWWRNENGKTKWNSGQSTWWSTDKADEGSCWLQWPNLGRSRPLWFPRSSPLSASIDLRFSWNGVVSARHTSDRWKISRSLKTRISGSDCYVHGVRQHFTTGGNNIYLLFSQVKTYVKTCHRQTAWRGCQRLYLIWRMEMISFCSGCHPLARSTRTSTQN